MKEIAVSCQESFAERELELWSNVVKAFERSFVGQTAPSDSNCVNILFPCCADKNNTQSYDINRPKS